MERLDECAVDGDDDDDRKTCAGVINRTTVFTAETVAGGEWPPTEVAAFDVVKT